MRVCVYRKMLCEALAPALLPAFLKLLLRCGQLWRHSDASLQGQAMPSPRTSIGNTSGQNVRSVSTELP